MPEDPPVPDVSAHLLRSADLIDLTLHAYHCHLDVDFDERALVADDDACLVVLFPPQHIAEEAWQVLRADGTQADHPPRPSQHRAAEPSRLVFDLPAGTRIPWQIDDVLAALPDLALRVSAGATPPGEPAHVDPEPPGPLETAIEAPYRLVISPARGSRFAHAVHPRGPDNRYELWRTHLADDAGMSVRALWARDFDLGGSNISDPPATSESLTSDERMQIAHQSQAGEEQPVSAALQVKQLALSSLGAWLDWAGYWDGPVAISEYQHQAQMGRDSYVRVAYPGFLYPFGHRCLLVKVSERGVRHVDTPVAYLWQRWFIMLREPTRNYPLSQRANPFTQVTLAPTITPDIDPPEGLDKPEAREKPFLVKRLGEPYPFTLETVDRAGARHSWTSPLVFAPLTPNHGALVIGGRNQLSGLYYSVSKVHGRAQHLAVAPPVKPGDTTVEVTSITFDGTIDDAALTSWPVVKRLSGVVPAMRHLSPSAPVVMLSFNEIYLKEGLPDRAPDQPTATSGPNLGEVILDLADAAGIDFSSGSDQAGGFVSPSLAVKGLSRALGAVGGDADGLAGGSFDPQRFFGSSLVPKLFGLFDLTEILQQAGLEEAPAFVHETTDGGVTARLNWRPKIGPWHLDDNVRNVFVPSSDQGLNIEVEVQSAKDKAPKVSISAALDGFALNLFGDGDAALMQLRFQHLRFRAGSSHKPEVDIAFDEVVFRGKLSYVDQLRRMIPLDGFSDPPYVDVNQEGITAGFDVALPNVAVGVFSLENIALGADARVPFLGDALTVGFRFCSKDSPFRLTVLCVGGGGWLELRAAPKGLVLLELGLEAAASLSVDLGVASGSVSVAVGAYLRLEGDEGLFTAYFRIRGEVSVLGLITASITLELALSYDTKRDKLHGRASLVVEVEVLFFSASVEIVVERQLAGSRGDPTMIHIMPPDESGNNNDWIAYCNAFAPLG